MNINVRADSVEIEGYVNAVERNSKTFDVLQYDPIETHSQ